MRTRTQGVGPDRWPVLLQGLWWPIHIAPQACSFGVWGGMGLRPGPHACLLPPWWLTLGHCTAIGGRTRLGRWLAGPCPPCVANRPSVARPIGRSWAEPLGPCHGAHHAWCLHAPNPSCTCPILPSHLGTHGALGIGTVRDRRRGPSRGWQASIWGHLGLRYRPKLTPNSLV